MPGRIQVLISVLGRLGKPIRGSDVCFFSNYSDAGGYKLILLVQLFDFPASHRRFAFALARFLLGRLVDINLNIIIVHYDNFFIEIVFEGTDPRALPDWLRY